MFYFLIFNPEEEVIFDTSGVGCLINSGIRDDEGSTLRVERYFVEGVVVIISPSLICDCV